jgi:hypothetical protein
MELLFIVSLFLALVILLAFWKDLKNMSGRQPKPKKREVRPAKESVSNKKNKNL